MGGGEEERGYEERKKRRKKREGSGRPAVKCEGKDGSSPKAGEGFLGCSG